MNGGRRTGQCLVLEVSDQLRSMNIITMGSPFHTERAKSARVGCIWVDRERVRLEAFRPKSQSRADENHVMTC
jgi:hypothetical protein